MRVGFKAYCAVVLIICGSSGTLPSRADSPEGLQKTVAIFTAERAPLQKLLSTLSTQAGLTFDVDWVRLYEVGVKRETLVTVQAEKRTASEILRDVLAGMHAERTISFHMDGETVCISTLSDLRLRFQIEKKFDVTGITTQHELLAAIIESVSPETWRDNGGPIGSARIAHGELVVNQSFDLMPAVETAVATYIEKHATVTRIYEVKDLVEATRDRDSQSKAEDLMDTLVVACSPGTWREHGGKTNGMSVFEGKLVVTGPAAVQGEIEATLDLLRKK